MASVRRKATSQFWFAIYKIPTGLINAKGSPVFRWVHRSTGLTDQTRARQLAISYERAAIAAAEKRFSENAALKFLAEIRAITDVAIGEVEPADAYLRRWLKSRQSAWAPNTRERYDAAIESFITWLGPRAGAPLAEIGGRTVALFRDAETATGKSPSTVNKTLGILAQAFDDAVTQRYFPVNPARGLNVRGAKRDRQRRCAFTFEQFAALVAAQPPARTSGPLGPWRQAPAEWRLLILLGGYTGGRQQELAKLQWEQIDFPRHRLQLNRTKTGDEHWLPIHPALEPPLRHAWQSAGQPRTGPVLPHLAPQPRRLISNTFRRAILPLIGLPQAYAPATPAKGVGRRLAPYGFHSLRHSLPSWLAAAGVDEMMRMRLIGHADKTVNRGYTHTDLAQAAAALAKVPGVAIT